MKKLLVTFIDALGPGELERARGGLECFKHRGAAAAPPGYTSAALATVLTGATPMVHGRLCLFSQTERTRSPLEPLTWLGLLPRSLHELPFVRRWVGQTFRDWIGWDGYFSLLRVDPKKFAWLDAPEKEDIFRAERIGRAPTFLGDARRAGLGVVSSRWQLPTQERLKHVLHAVDQQQPQLVFHYESELDRVLHEGGPDCTASAAELRRIGDRVCRVRDRMARGGHQVTTLVVGDHGMARVTRTVDPSALLGAAHRLRTVVDATLLRAWGDDLSLMRLRAAVDRLRVPGRFLGTAELAALGIPTRGAPWGQAMVQLDEGALFVPSDAGGFICGMHGYGPGAPSSRAGVASDGEIPPFRSLTDIAPWVRRSIGLEAA